MVSLIELSMTIERLSERRTPSGFDAVDDIVQWKGGRNLRIEEVPVFLKLGPP